jgi:hypothetical protein
MQNDGDCQSAATHNAALILQTSEPIGDAISLLNHRFDRFVIGTLAEEASAIKPR